MLCDSFLLSAFFRCPETFAFGWDGGDLGYAFVYCNVNRIRGNRSLDALATLARRSRKLGLFLPVCVPCRLPRGWRCLHAAPLHLCSLGTRFADEMSHQTDVGGIHFRNASGNDTIHVRQMGRMVCLVLIRSYFIDYFLVDLRMIFD